LGNGITTMHPPKVLFLVPYPIRLAPSQRFRVEQFEPYLKEAGIDYCIEPFIDEKTWSILYKKGNTILKAMGILKGYLRRFRLALFEAGKFDYIFVHREATPLGPPVIEWIIAKLLGKKVIYDFDDAIWIPNITSENKLVSNIKAFWKVPTICRWSYKVVTGNDYLNGYASRQNRSSVIIPTCVDVENRHNRIKGSITARPVIGWTGSHSTLFYLNDIIPVIRELQERHDFSFMVIADKKPELGLKHWEFLPWNEKSEIEDLLRLDIGVMPLKPDQWSEGKCGFKLIQYLALGIPAVADPVGVNKTIIDHGVNGFVCSSPSQWKECLEMLLNDPRLRLQMGSNGRKKIVDQYSVQSQYRKFLSLFS
jgi:glycosyltransferase involved in cell wall biosynthesis